MSALLASVPLAVVLFGMGVLRLSAAIAGAIGLAIAVLLSTTIFGTGAAPVGPARLLWGAFAEALHSTATILWIVLPALAIFEFQKRSGAIARMRDTLAALTEDRRLQVILIAWFFGLFMEGAAGFGTPVALAAPLLVGLGYDPVRAVVLALLGHAAGVSFGAVGTPVLAQVEVSDLSASDIAVRTAVLHAICGPVLLVWIVRLAGCAPLSRADLSWTALAAICFLGPSLALAILIGPELPSLGGALVGAAGFVAILRWRRGGPDLRLRPLLPDVTPYLLILFLVLVTRLLPSVQEGLTGLSLRWTLWDRFGGSFSPLYHPGTILFLGLLIGAAAQGGAALLGDAVSSALRRAVPVALALLVMLALSRLMVHSGMVGMLAATAASAGPAWPILAPLVGVLGTFITGSATASNILFTELQVSTAESLGWPATMLVAAQGFGAAIGNVIAPHNIIAGCATVGLVAREGEVLARTATPCLVYALLGGAVAYLGLLLA